MDIDKAIAEMEKEEKELLQDVAVKKAAEEARNLYKKVGEDLPLFTPCCCRAHTEFKKVISSGCSLAATGTGRGGSSLCFYTAVVHRRVRMSPGASVTSSAAPAGGAGRTGTVYRSPASVA
jgi:hypothetical protein